MSIFPPINSLTMIPPNTPMDLFRAAITLLPHTPPSTGPMEGTNSPKTFAPPGALVNHLIDIRRDMLRLAVLQALNPHGVDVEWDVEAHAALNSCYALGHVGDATYAFTPLDVMAATRAAMMYAFPDMPEADIDSALVIIAARLFCDWPVSTYLEARNAATRTLWPAVRVIVPEKPCQSEVIQLLGMPAAPYLLPLSRITTCIQRTPALPVVRFAASIPRDRNVHDLDDRCLATNAGKAFQGLTADIVKDFMRKIYTAAADEDLDQFSTALLNQLRAEMICEVAAGDYFCA